MYRRIRKKRRSKYHIQLSLAIFLMLVVFVAGVDKTAVVGGCIATSVLLHYFILVSILFMLAESVRLFEKLVIVFHSDSMKELTITSLACWCKFS